MRAILFRIARTTFRTRRRQPNPLDSTSVATARREETCLLETFKREAPLLEGISSSPRLTSGGMHIESFAEAIKLLQWEWTQAVASCSFSPDQAAQIQPPESL